MNRICGIYKIQNVETGDFYVGSSINIKQRFRVHKSSLRGCYHPNNHLQRAWDKYGETSFSFAVLEETTEEGILEREQWYLDNWKPRYNMALFALAPMKGRKMSKETRAKMSAAMSGKNNPMYGKPGTRLGATLSEETKKKIGKANSEREHPSGKDHPNFGRKHSKKSRENMSKSHIGKMKGEEHWHYGKRGKDSPLFGRKRSHETRMKMSIKAKGKKWTKDTWIKSSGENGNKAKLKNSDILEIHQKYSSGEYSQKELCRIYGVSPAAMSNIINKKTYKIVWSDDNNE